MPGVAELPLYQSLAPVAVVAAAVAEHHMTGSTLQPLGSMGPWARHLHAGCWALGAPQLTDVEGLPQTAWQGHLLCVGSCPIPRTKDVG